MENIENLKSIISSNSENIKKKEAHEKKLWVRILSFLGSAYAFFIMFNYGITSWSSDMWLHNGVVSGHSMDSTLYDGEPLIFQNITSPNKGDIITLEMTELARENKKEESNKGSRLRGEVGKAFYVKRCIALPGDTISYDNKTDTLTVNDKVVDESKINKLFTPEGDITRTINREARRETLIRFGLPLSFKDLDTLQEESGGTPDSVFKNFIDLNNKTKFRDYVDLDGNIVNYKIPEGYIFFMGDNRSHSSDSRIFGPVPMDWYRGKAFAQQYTFIYLPVEY
jgi:signal peptidase I